MRLAVSPHIMIDQISEQNLSSVGMSSQAPSSKFETWVIRNMGIMKAQLNQIQESLDVLIDRRQFSGNGGMGLEAATGSGEDFEGYKLVPVKSVEDMNQLSDLLSNDSKRNAMVDKLSKRGGNSVSECVRRILQCLLTNKMAVKFNWIGSRGQKMGFKNSIFLDIVYESTRKSRKMGSVEEKTMEDIIKDWLKNARKRIACEEMSKLKNQPRDNTE